MTENMKVLPGWDADNTTLASYSSFNSENDSVSCVIYKMSPSDFSPSDSGTALTFGEGKTMDGSPALSSNVQLYKKRFIILILFCLYSASNAFQWLQYAIITTKISTFYGIDDLTVNLTSMIYMFVFVPGMLPASWLLNRAGLRTTVLIGSFGTFLGSVIKCLSISPDRFWVAMIGQTLVAICNLFVLNLPPRIAAVWFGEKEVSTATSIGVFGNQIGVCLGFFLPPLIVIGSTQQQISSQLALVCYGTATFTVILFLTIIFLFEDNSFYCFRSSWFLYDGLSSNRV